MDKPIYIVTAGSYSDYHIERVFENKTKAEAYAEIYNKTQQYDSDKAEVEEYAFSDNSYDVSNDMVGWLYEFLPDGQPYYKECVLRTKVLERVADLPDKFDYVFITEDDDEKAVRVYRENKMFSKAKVEGVI